MEREYSAKTVEEAVANAAADFGCAVSELEYSVVQEGSKGILGIGKKDAVIKANYTKNENTAAQDAEIKNTAEEIKDENPEVSENSESVNETLKPKKIIPLDENIKIVENYLIDVIHHLGVDDITIESECGDEGVKMQLSCDATHKGTIIGKRGETLDSLQYLASVILNRGTEEYVRLNLDSNGYRDKRKQTLEQLARKIARQVLKSGRNNTLEPMNPYERRIIHSVISEIDGVSSHSVGEEPYRKVVITSDNPRRGGKNYKGRNGRGGNGKRRYKDDKNYIPKPKSMDSFKTSFEKDYKKSKPEDDIHGGLYGKIDI